MSRGRGDAALSFGDETDLDDDDFEAEALTPAEFLDLENSEVLSTSLTDGDEEAVGEAAGFVDLADSTGSAAWRRRLSPSQRAAVRRYFQTATQDESP